MPYKDPQIQKASQAKYFQENKKQINKKQNEKRAEWRKVVQEAKNKPCMDCGETYPYYVMELDHRPGSRKFRAVSELQWFSSLEKVMEEISKCDVVCSNCHQERTHQRGAADES